MKTGRINDLLNKKTLSFLLVVFLALALGHYWGRKSQKAVYFNPIKVIQLQSAVKKTIPPTPSDQTKIDNYDIQSQKLRDPFKNKALVTTQPLQELSSDALAVQLKLLDQLIDENPDNYAFYKKKILILLTQEIKFHQAIDVQVYEDLYDQMLEFTDFQSVPEDNSNSVKDTNGLQAPELLGIDQDLVHIPFLRWAALSEFTELYSMAQDYIDTYPNSYIGYFYRSEALWRQGEQEAAIES
ncbi:MAG: hypothetical protein KDD40_06925, partial [Bdellovibrionales bacterium]|nr:hypothetical protein [Bdellovibrionales bacterium]